MKNIFEPADMKHLHLKNRLIRSATWEGLARADGGIDERTYDIYTELAKGGVGGIITGFTSVSLQDHYFKGMMRLSNEELIPQYKKLVDIIHAENCPGIAQLALGAYYRKEESKYIQTEPDEMTSDEIHEVTDQFARASVYAKKAGFDGVQIHAAHFFFLSRFISPAVNHRIDDYGGSAQNRSRIILEIMEKIRAAAPDLHISVKINSSDFTRGGLVEPESLEICKLLDRHGTDSIEISGNGTSVSAVKPYVNEGYFVPFAANAAASVSCPVIVVGGIRSIDTMEKVLQGTDIEFISLSRPLLCEPELPVRMQSGESKVSRCISCNQCYSTHAHRCVFRL